MSFSIGDTIEFIRVKKVNGMNEFETLSGEVVELPTSQRHLPHLVYIKLDAQPERDLPERYGMFKRADMIAPLVLICG